MPELGWHAKLPHQPDETGYVRCNDTSQSTGEPCKRWAGPSGVCVVHDGRARRGGTPRPSERQKAVERATKFLQGTGVTRINDPIQAMEDLAAEVVAVKDFFRNQITELRYESERTGEQLRAEVLLYERALDRSIKVLDLLAKLGISERRQALAEAQAVAIAGTIDNILERLNLTVRQRALALKVVPEELRALSAPEEEPVKEFTGVGAFGE